MMKKPFLPLDLSTCTLEPTCIDIYCFTLDDALPKPYQTILSDEEQKRADRFYFKHHQHHFRRARLILRLILARYLEVTPESLQFDYLEHGKPYLPAYPNLEFNLSHSGEYALLAVGEKYPLGVDIERYTGRPYAGIGEHVFSETENENLKNLPGSLKPLMFFNTWAQKEAFIKLLGLGLSYPTTKLTVPGLLQAAHQFHDPIHKGTWCLLPFMPKIGYAGALCCHPDIETVRYTTYP